MKLSVCLLPNLNPDNNYPIIPLPYPVNKCISKLSQFLALVALFEIIDGGPLATPPDSSIPVSATARLSITLSSLRERNWYILELGFCLAADRRKLTKRAKDFQ